ncbi:MAG: carboxylating nicotinate-nucleotide diphosphorylase [Candidatus Omnitrophica bacterium]|nr:carboxylating nicotinate-nucleotide diphosphorylase [Candidatus Omnitrophota bacterium]
MKDLDKKKVDTIIRFALKEDVWTGDITSRSVLDRFLDADAVIIAKERGTVCGLNIVERVFAAVDCTLRFRPVVKDGDSIEEGQEIAFVEGAAQSILRAERTALNFLGMLSGVSTQTSKMVKAVEGSGIKIYDTRKTIPLHRYLEKYAVTVGGGHNHRKGLWDMVLIKDNHIRAFSMQIKSNETEKVIRGIIKRARDTVQKNIRVEIEVETLKECEYALLEKADVIMLDNMSREDIEKAVDLRKEKGFEKEVLFEISGGITLNNVREYISTGVDIISSGSITAFVQPIDFSLETIFRK